MANSAVRLVANALAPIMAGTTVTNPARHGNNTLRQRCPSSAFIPFCRHSIAVKYPLTTMNNGMRKPCTHDWNTYAAPLWLTSTAIHDGPSANDNDAWYTIPRSIAAARNASRSCLLPLAANSPDIPPTDPGALRHVSSPRQDPFPAFAITAPSQVPSNISRGRPSGCWS